MLKTSWNQFTKNQPILLHIAPKTARKVYRSGIHSADQWDYYIFSISIILTKNFKIISKNRYKLPIASIYAPKIGFEYNYGSKYWTGFLSNGGGDMVNKLGTNGDACELYFIQPVDEKHLYFRAGAVYMDFDYNNPMTVYGSQQKSDMSITNFICLPTWDFNP